MSSILQPSDFKAEILVANTEQSYVSMLLQQFIDKYEVVYLTSLLGSDLYDLYIAGLAVMPTPDAKWTALKAKISYGTADFVYWYYMGNLHTQSVGVGEKQTKAANADTTSPILKMVRAWDEMVDINFCVVKFITDNPDDYGVYYLPNFYCWNRWTLGGDDRPKIFYKTNEFDF